jgi:hypothetical protein
MIEAKKMEMPNNLMQLNFIKELALYPEKRVILQDIAVCYYSLNDKKPLFHTYEYLTIQILMMEKQNICYRVVNHKIQDKTNSCKYLNLTPKNFPGSKELFNQLCQILTTMQNIIANNYPIYFNEKSIRSIKSSFERK